MRLINFDGRMSISDRMNAIAQWFFFTRDVEKSRCFISDWTDIINGNDSHPSSSSELLNEDEESNLMVMPNFTYKLTCSSMM